VGETAHIQHRLIISVVASADAKNLEAISKAIDQHNANCPFPASEVRMSPFEVERLGWEEIRGLPIIADPALSTGRFRIVCSQEGEETEIEEVEAIGEPVEVER
jgi:TusA-related sulfurtransferase